MTDIAKEMLNEVDKMNFPKVTKKNLYSIKDLKAGFITIFICENDLIALRNFSQDVNNPQSPLYKFSEDFELWKLGTLGYENGALEPDAKYMARAMDYKKTQSTNNTNMD